MTDEKELIEKKPTTKELKEAEELLECWKEELEKIDPAFNPRSQQVYSMASALRKSKEKHGLMTKKQALSDNKVGAEWAEKMAEDKQIQQDLRHIFMGLTVEGHKEYLKTVARILRERGEE